MEALLLEKAKAEEALSNLVGAHALVSIIAKEAPATSDARKSAIVALGLLQTAFNTLSPFGSQEVVAELSLRIAGAKILPVVGSGALV